MSPVDLIQAAWSLLTTAKSGVENPTAQHALEDMCERLLDTLAAKDTALAEWKAMHGRVVEGFMEVCEAVGVQFDAPEAVAYAINARINNAEHDKRAAEAALAEMRVELERVKKALEPFKQIAKTEIRKDEDDSTKIPVRIGFVRAAALSQSKPTDDLSGVGR